ncbi:MAG: cellulase family glycosylhydrolase [Bacteroidales bacterium]|nr:cellulase family glycosylhydrolase [Bacteroidales bacterium]
MAALIASCGDDNERPQPPEPDPAPTVITLSSNSFQVQQAGEKLTLTITAPARPSLSGLPSWIAYTDGTYSNYSITVGLTVAANETYEARSETVTVSSNGVSPVTFSVSQAAKERPSEPGPVPGPGHEDNDAWKMASTLGIGWNMGNHFDAFYNGSWAGEKEGYPDENAWQPGGNATPATFTGVKAAGFTSVRIPVSWLKMIGPAPSHTIDKAWLDRVYEVVGFAHDAGLNVIINTHQDENHGVNNGYQWLDIKNAVNNAGLNESIKAEIKAVWTQIAERFADCGDWLVMEGFNEINDGGWGWSEDFRKDPTRQCGILNEWNQVFVDAVRATGGENATRWLGVPTYAASPEYAKYLKMPEDKAGKLMVSVHFYDPSDYTIGDAQYSDWGHTGARARKRPGETRTMSRRFSAICTRPMSQRTFRSILGSTAAR